MGINKLEGQEPKTPDANEPGKERREYWANLDTPNKAVEASLQNLAVLQHLSPNEIKTTADWIVGGLRNAGFSLDRTGTPAGSEERKKESGE